MDSKYTVNAFVKKSPVNNRPKHIIFNGPVPQKIAKLEPKCHSSPGKQSPTKSKSPSKQRQSLPVFNARQKLVSLVEKYDVLIIIGETGCGKTTQIPQFIYEERLNGSKIIGVTQPRRVAATTLSARVAEEMGTAIGETVGYSIRFEDVTSHGTKLKFLTDGMLLREAISDEKLMQYGVIILDEAHERTVHTDVLFGIIKKAHKLRNEKCLPVLKVIIMSATMDVDHFSSYFGDVSVVYLEGRQYPVEVFHSVKPQEDYIFSCLVTVFQIHQEAPPNEDILVFLTGQEEIESFTLKVKSIMKDLENVAPPLRVLPLYSSLPSTQLAEAFRPTPHGFRKIVISTNVAETSVTIPGIKYVIDSGKVKTRNFNPTTGLDVLQVRPISQAQAWQRTGRAGRDSSGFCYRVFTQDEFEKFEKNSQPEIQRCNLASVSLQLLTLGINILNFDFMDKPPKESLKSALVELKMLGAIDSTENPQLTKLGRQMAQFPVDPRYSKILLSACDFGCVDEIISIIALLSGESILIHPMTRRDEAREAHKKFLSSCGDHITLLNVFRNFKKVSQQKQWCRENYLHCRNLMYAMNVRKQLLEICRRNDIAITSCNQNMDQVRKCLITGLFMNVAELQLDKKYIMISTNQAVSIHPSSVLSNSLPHCVLYSEVIHTTKCYVRQCTVVDPDWLMEAMPEYFRQHRLSVRR
ncbi:hypothetical protein RUM43_009424 [Polyplax serrata]|uniref:RNA helicase n=1 Tax=Polyplax serrata TaxID=468196 RepID=A0AAN8PD23_POLSC